MPRKVIAVEAALSPIKEYLREQGYDVVDLDRAQGTVDAVVVRGTDNNLLGGQDIVTRAPVIEASGLTPEQVGREIERRTGL